MGGTVLTDRPWVSIRSDQLVAQIDPLGAQLSTLRDDAGRDLLWDGNPAVWTGRAPLLFPIVGELAGGMYRLGSKTYPLSRHGFARGKLFSVSAARSSSVTFHLLPDEATWQVYPFKFELEVRFELAGATLSLTTWIRNLGNADMIASFGYHPALRWPLPFGQPRAAHFIEFDHEEPAPVRRIDAAGLLTAQLHPTPIVDRRLNLNDALFQDDVLILDQVESRAVIYGGDSGPRVRVAFPDAPYLGIWTKPHAQFICIEPWHGIADPQGYAGDFSRKPGVFALAPGAALSANVSLTVLP